MAHLPARPIFITAGIVVAAAAALYAGTRARNAHRAHLNVRDVDASACPEAMPLGGACGACVANECCAEIHACYSDTRCIDLNDCWVRCGDADESPKVPRAECPSTCEKRSPTAVATFHAWDDCARSRCGSLCPRGPSEEEEEE